MHDPLLMELFDDESPMYRLEWHIGSTLTYVRKMYVNYVQARGSGSKFIHYCV